MSDDDWERWLRRRRFPFSRGWFFDDIDEIIREMEEAMEKDLKEFSKHAPKELMRERVLPDGTRVQEWGPFVYGHSITIGPDGKPEIREFGNIKRGEEFGRPRLDIKEEREPLVDVMSTNGEVKVITELPGVEKGDIKLRATENTLNISVDTPRRKYYKSVELPAKIDPKRAKSLYKNGVLEITLTKKKGEPPSGETIHVE